MVRRRWPDIIVIAGIVMLGVLGVWALGGAIWGGGDPRPEKQEEAPAPAGGGGGGGSISHRGSDPPNLTVTSVT